MVQIDEQCAFADLVSSACSLWLTTAVGPTERKSDGPGR